MSDITCPRCNALSEAGSAYCANCGSPFRPSRSPRSQSTDGRSYVAAGRPTGPVSAAPRQIRRGRQPVSPTHVAASTAGGAAALAAPHAQAGAERSASPARTGAERVRRPIPVARRPWYQRWRVVVPVVLLALLVTGVAAGAWYINARFDSLNELSTPPPEITGADLGIAEELPEEEVEPRLQNPLTIDTSAASEHVEERKGDDPNLPNAPEGSMVILVMGVDAREGEPIDIKVRADSLSVVYLDGEDNSCRMLSIPRDTQVDLKDYGATKINAALSIGGIPYQQLVVEQVLGIDIDHYGLIDFAGVITLVDAVGGVSVENDEEFTSRSNITYASGRITLNGFAALEYARYRDGADGDWGRQRRQQQVVRALLSEGASLNAVTAIPEMLDAVEGHVRTDLGPTDLIDIAQEYRSDCSAETLEAESLQGTIASDYDDVMEMELSFVHIEDAEIEQKMTWLLGED